MIIKNEVFENYKSNLKKRREAIGMTQSELSEISGVNVKSISLYEQNPERINKASGHTLYNISHCLLCNIEDILEPRLMVSE